MSIREIIAEHRARVREDKQARRAGSRYGDNPHDPRNLVYDLTGGAVFEKEPELHATGGPAARRGPRNHSARQVIAETPAAPAAPAAERQLMAATAPAAVEPAASEDAPTEAPAVAAPTAHTPEFDLDDEKDKNPFVHDERVAAMREQALNLGRLDLAERIERGYADLLNSRYDAMETHYRTDLMPKVQAMQRVLTDFEGQQLPKKIRAEAMRLSAEETQAREAMVFYAYGLVRNPLTKQLGLERFSNSDLLAPGTRATDARVDAETGMIELIDDTGQIAKLPNGELAQWPVQDAEEGYLRYFGNKRERKLVKLKPGEAAFDEATGEEVVSNPDQSPGGGAKPSDVRADLNMVDEDLLIVHGATPNPVTGKPDPTTIKDWPAVMQSKAEIETLVSQGVQRRRAVLMVAERVKQQQLQQAAQGEGAAAADEGDLPQLW